MLGGRDLKASLRQFAIQPVAGGMAARRRIGVLVVLAIVASVAMVPLAARAAGVPAVSSVAPSGGPLAGGTGVTITGTSFTGATAVSFGTTAAVTFNVASDTQITATSPAGSAGPVDVTVTAVDGSSAIVPADQFTYAAAPAVSSVAPSGGPAAGGTSVAISGTNFTGATAVSFGSAAASFTVTNDTQISATSPAGTGLADVTVTTVGGTSATSAADHFTYTGSPAVST
ncbi:MAG: hypothetical protein QOH92_1609, partial [Chloroflexota bacterium]|nr:hypothetical protein [Chloroflexota bacterium]